MPDDPSDTITRLVATSTSIEGAICLLRGQRVLLDHRLAEFYGVGTKVLNQAVRRNAARFPDDFLFHLTESECVTLGDAQPVPAGRGGRRYPSLAFTEQGVAMLSSVLRSPRAVAVNVEIMRAFVRLRRWAGEHAELAHRLHELEREFGVRTGEHAAHIERIYALLDELVAPEPGEDPEDRERIGFRTRCSDATGE